MNKQRLHFLVTALAALSLSASVTAQTKVNVAGAQTVRAKAAETGIVRVIARLSPTAAPPGQLLTGRTLATVQRSVEERMTAADVAYVEPLADLPFVVVEVTQKQLDTLVESGLVDAVQQDVVERAYLAQSVPLINAPDAWDEGARGAGQTVAVLDSGIDSGHAFLGGRVVAEACFSSNSPSQGASTVCPNGQTSQTGQGAGSNCTVSGCDHGTHVAGIAAGSGPSSAGVAPDASIISIQVFSRFDDQPNGPQTCLSVGTSSPCILTFRSDQIRALQHVRNLAGQFTMASVNMSLGGGQFTSTCDTDLRKASIDQLRSIGIATIIASGNDGFTNAVGAPGCISTAVTVGSTTKSDNVSGFSNSSSSVDLLAPGSSINSSIPGGGFAFFNGTSMATPHVAGAFAALRSGIAASTTVDEIQNALETTGQPITDSRNSLTRPRIDVAAALTELTGGAPPPPPTPTSSACSLCYTCGGEWPVFSGSIPIRENARPYSRTSACGGELRPRNDDLPYLCCKSQ